MRDCCEPAARDGRLGGFTLLEVLLALGIAGILGAIAIPAYRSHADRVRVKRSITEIRVLEDHIEAFELENRAFPPSLALVGAESMRDPWGTPYQYLRIAGPNPPEPGKVRKDKNLNPLNSDYDLYSKGPDGDSKLPLSTKVSHDDIVRANDGAFVGVAADY
jgi:general secretion pathway protein G